MKKVLISGYYGFLNSGDDAILYSMVSDIRSRTDEVEIFVLTNDEEITYDQVKARGVPRFNFFKIWKALGKVDLLISGGGSLLQDVTSSRSLWYYLAVIFLAKLRKKPVYVYANGVGPINGRFNRILTGALLKKVDIITLRDRDSAKFVKTLGVQEDKVRITADPVFSLKPVGDHRVMEILKYENIVLSNETVGISLRPWLDDSVQLRKIGDALKSISLANPELDFLFIPLHYPQDHGFNELLLEYLEWNPKFKRLEGVYSAQEVMGIIKKMDAMIAMRLHSLIYSAVVDTPMVAIAYDPKIEGFMGELSLNYGADIETLEENSFTELFNLFWDNRIEESRKLQESWEVLYNKSQENVNILLALLGVKKYQ